MYLRFIIKNCLHGNGGWEVPQSHICELEAQESPWCSSVRVPRPENQRSDGPSPKAGEDGCPIWAVRQSEFSLHPSVLFRPSMDWMKPYPQWGGQSALLSLRIQILISSRTLSQTHIISHRNNVESNIWTPPDPGKPIHIINHHEQAASEMHGKEKALKH